MEIQELKNRIKAYINRIDYKTKKLQEIEALLDEEESYVKYCNTYKKGNSIASQPFILKKEILNEFNEIIKKLNSVELFNLLSIYCKKEQDQLKMFDNYKESYSPKVTFPKAFEDKKQCDREEKKFSCICITGFIGFLADIIYMLSMFFIPTSSLFVMFVVPVLIASLSAGAIVVGALGEEVGEENSNCFLENIKKGKYDRKVKKSKDLELSKNHTNNIDLKEKQASLTNDDLITKEIEEYYKTQENETVIEEPIQEESVTLRKKLY